MTSPAYFSLSFTTLTLRVITAVTFASLALLSLSIMLGDHAFTNEIAFVSYRTGYTEIYIMDVNRGFVHSLTNLRNYTHNPAWSPDGEYIAFESTHEGEYGIFVVDAAGYGLRRLVPGRGGSPAWSPDGAQIAFSSERDGNYEIYTANADGSDIRRLTFDKASDFNPAWSPDGAHIIFQSDRGGSYRHAIYSIDTDGRNLQLLTDKNATSIDPAWSPDGRWIIFMSTQSGGKNLHIMDAAGGNVQPLTPANGAYDGSPAWSPDGTRVVFDSDRYRNGYAYGWGIYVMNVDGSDMRLLTEGVRPAWRP
jgi:Tol biopolymer transport system component